MLSTEREQEMKIKKELTLIILFSINAGMIILAICYNILKHQWLNIPTNGILLLVSIYFLSYFIDIFLNKTSRAGNILIGSADLLMESSRNMIDWAGEFAKKLTSREEVVLDIVCEDEKYLPAYSNPTDACMDLKIKIQEPHCYFLQPNQTEVFSTGIKVSIPTDYTMLIYPRSSTGFKLNCILTNTTGIVDAGYRDEVKLSITNFGKESVCLKDGQRIAQFMIVKRPYINLNPVCDDVDFRSGDRQGGIGSTGE